MPERWEDLRHDEDGDRRDALDRLERSLEKASLDYAPTKACDDCGCVPKELFTGTWVCGCALPVGTAL